MNCLKKRALRALGGGAMHAHTVLIAKKIVDDHRGTIEVNSEENKGTTFKITLPRKART